jgi:hypothetical protein
MDEKLDLTIREEQIDLGYLITHAKESIWTYEREGKRGSRQFYNY